MSKFLQLYNLIMEELITEGYAHVGDIIEFLPNSRKLGLYHFNITSHAFNRDFERSIMDEIGYNSLYNFLDELCVEIIKNRKLQISTLNRFCGLIHKNDNYFKIIIAFNNIREAALITGISITKQQYNNLLNKDYYIDSNDRYNFIILKN